MGTSREFRIQNSRIQNPSPGYSRASNTYILDSGFWNCHRLRLRDLVGGLDNLEGVSSGHGNLERIQNSARKILDSRILDSEFFPGILDSGFLNSEFFHFNVSAKEKIGKYSATNTNVTNPPMQIMMAGSISDSVAVIRVLTSSS
jgi:hypothetical protein